MLIRRKNILTLEEGRLTWLKKWWERVEKANMDRLVESFKSSFYPQQTIVNQPYITTTFT